MVYSTCSVCVEENEQVVQYALSRRANVRIVETGLTFGVEGFRRYRGKVFDERMAWTRRYYPHKYNVDGFFVAKLRKVGPSPNKGDAAISNGISDGVSVNDKAPVVDGEEGGDDEFGGFDEEEDEKVIERARRQQLRRKGLNPKAVMKRANKSDGARKGNTATRIK